MTALSKKVILVGHFNVGKTSLIKQFVYTKFSEEYLSTIGVNIEKKVVQVNDVQLTMIIWEIAGEDSIDKSPLSYILGAHGIIYVFDLTRESTWLNIGEQLESLKRILPNAPIRVIGNKNDLVSAEQIAEILDSLPIECNYTSSAKTGDNVEDLFLDMANELVS